MQESPVEIQIPAHWNLIGRSVTAPTAVLSPSSTLPPPSSHCAYIPARNISARSSKFMVSIFISF
jgi:hypothetical protein